MLIMLAQIVIFTGNGTCVAFNYMDKIRKSVFNTLPRIACDGITNQGTFHLFKMSMTHFERS